jgi:hypothetical protein
LGPLYNIANPPIYPFTIKPQLPFYYNSPFFHSPFFHSPFSHLRTCTLYSPLRQLAIVDSPNRQSTTQAFHTHSSPLTLIISVCFTLPGRRQLLISEVWEFKEPNSPPFATKLLISEDI